MCVGVKEQEKISRKQRRQSLIERGLISQTQKKQSEEEKQAALARSAEDLELKRLAALDVQKYKEECTLQWCYSRVHVWICVYIGKKQEILELQLDAQISKTQQQAEELRVQQEKEQLQAELEAKHEDWLAKEEYKKGQEESRRQSLALRNQYYFEHVKCKRLLVHVCVDW